jgi:sugar-specific transcriptional regulator TrmB
LCARDELPQLLDEIVVGLVKLGLTETQARVYSTALKLGIASASVIARSSCMNRGSTYRIIDELVKMDALKLQLGTPDLYVPKNMGEIVQQLLKKNHDELTSKINTANQLVTKASEALVLQIHESYPPKSSHFQLLKNRRQRLKMAVKLWKDARVEVLWIGPGRALSKLANEWMNKVFRTSCEQGVSWRMVTEVNDLNRDEVREMSRYCEIRHFPKLPMLLSICDRKSVLFGASPTYMSSPNTDDEPHLLVEDPATGDAYVLFFESLWATASKIDTNPPKRNKIFSRGDLSAEAQLRQILSPQVEVQR